MRQQYPLASDNMVSDQTPRVIVITDSDYIVSRNYNYDCLRSCNRLQSIMITSFLSN